MDPSQHDAHDSLLAVEGAAARTQKAIAAGYASTLLILWGLICMAGFTAVHLRPGRAAQIFGILNAAGVVGSVAVCRRWPTRTSVRSAVMSRTARGILVFWVALFAYAVLWTFLLSPVSGTQIGAFFVTVGMLGYVTIGLWSGSHFMIWLGLAVTVSTVAGYYLLAHSFHLWMALTSGGALLGMGLYIRIRWR